MAELLPRERLQPALIDRLTDNAPATRVESRDERVLTLSQLRDSVLRDLEWLFNSVALEGAVDLTAFPRVAASVVNYGLPSLAGASASSTDPAVLERTLSTMIQRFEPRLVPGSVRVQSLAIDKPSEFNAIAFEIRAELWAQPAPLALRLRTEVDLEDGNVTVTAMAGA